MSSVVLTNLDDPAFTFHHAMAHRNALGIMAPLTRYSVVPYFVDPMLALASAGPWQLNHQQAHNDALADFPTYFDSMHVGLRVGQNMVDTDLNDPVERSWFQFQNHMEHYIGAQTFAPPPTVQPRVTWTFPFW
jgi:hypothetical protein